MRVFISSTSEDLAPYRAAAEAVVLDLGWKPDGMEHFGTEGSLGIVEACARRVEKVDVVLAIIAWRRGGVPTAKQGGDGKTSYTKWEIEAAFRRHKPVLVLMAADTWPGNSWEDDAVARAWVKDFRGELDRLAEIFEWERPEAGAKEPLPVFRAKVRQELLRHQENLLSEKSGDPGGTPKTTPEVKPRVWPEPAWPDRPYPLLLPYTHPALFAGRDRELAELDRLVHLPQPILSLHASSGAGKSSLLAAGLVPTLRARGRPVAFERRPAEPGLAERLVGDLLATDGGGDALAVDDSEPHTFVEHLITAEHLAGKAPLLVLDQFEDLMRPESARARATLGLLLAASSQRRPGREGPACRWLLAYREDFHGRVSTWLRDVLKDARDLKLPAAETLPHDLSDADRSHAWPLPPLGTPPAGADRVTEATRIFRGAIETPLALVTDAGAPRYPWRFAGDGAGRLAHAFADARVAQPDAPLVPELQVVLAHLVREAGEPGAEPAEVQVPKRLEAVIDRALENHLHGALNASFVGRPAAAARAGRTRVLLALRQLADSEGKRADSLPAADLAAAIGDGGAEVLEGLARGDTRLIVSLEHSESLHYALSHDRLAEVVVRIVEEEGLHGDLDTDLLALRRFVRLNTELYLSEGPDQATRIKRGRFSRIESDREALIRGEDSTRWWEACRARQRSDRRRFAATVAVVLIAALIVTLAGSKWTQYTQQRTKQRTEQTELLSQLRSTDPDQAIKALDRLIADHGADTESLRQDLEKDQILRLLEGGVDAIAEERRSEAVISMLEAVWPLLDEHFENLRTVGLLAWMIDVAAHDNAVRDRAVRLRETLLAPLREKRPQPAPIDFEWAEIPGGTFQMGSDKLPDEQSQHAVTLEGFKISVHEVTNQQYRYLVPEHGDEALLPAVRVSWYEAYAYAAWLGGRLPTEAEWEYAARAGCSHAYCDRNGSETTLSKVGWYNKNSGGKLHPVMQLEPNPWGLHDVYGNAWEWVADWYSGGYPEQPQVDPLGPPSGNDRVARGGRFTLSAENARAAVRNKVFPENEFVGVGFRVVLPAAPSHSMADP